MRSLDKINEYAQQVCSQITWKKARARISVEITDHIIDSRDAFISQGMDELSATESAIVDTGDALEIGTQLDSIHRPRPQRGMLAATAFFVMLGLLVRLFVFNDAAMGGSLLTRIIFIVIGISGMLGAYFSDFTILLKFPGVIYIGIVFGITALWFALDSVSPSMFGRLWFSSYIIILSPIAFVSIIFSLRSKGYWGALIYGLAFIPIGFFALSFNFLAGFINVMAIWLILFGIAVIKNWFGRNKLCNFLIIAVPPALLLALLFAQNGDLVLRWIRAAVDPATSPDEFGYWGVIARGLLSGAKPFGSGYIPEAFELQMSVKKGFFSAHLLLVWLVAHIGWVASAFIITALTFFIVNGFQRCMRQRSDPGLFVSLAVILSLSFQSFGYIVYNLGFQLGNQPVSLPLVSYGNVEMVINLVIIGFMLSVFRTGDLVADEYGKQGDGSFARISSK